MLYVMRNKMKSFVMWIIIGAFVTTIFVAWGMGNSQRGAEAENWVAKVNAETIPLADYERELRQLEAQFRDFPPELTAALNLKEQALDRMISRRLFQLQAEKMDVEVGDEELAAAIQSIPAFQEQGSFNAQVYRAFLAQNRLTPSVFEQDLRSDLRVTKVQSLMQDSVKVSEDEIYAKYLEQNERMTVSYALIKAEDRAPEGKPTEEEIVAYYDLHKEEFRTDDQVNAVFTYVTPQDFFDDIPVTDETIEKYYADNRSLYVQPERVQARHILIRAPQDGDEAAIEAARERIEGLLAQVREGADFAALARENSDDSTAARGGDLGFFERGVMVKEFEEAAFGLAPGEVSPIIRTRFGFHIIKVEEKRPEEAKPLAEAREEILREIKSEPAMRLARKNAMALYNTIRRGKDFRETIGQAGLTLQETGYFSRRETQIMGVPADLAEAFREESFSAGADDAAGMVRGERGYLLLKTEARKPAAIPELAEVRDQVSEAVLAVRAKENAREISEAMVASLEAKTGFDTVAAKYPGVDIVRTDPFSRSEIQVSPDFTKTAFTLGPDNPAALVEAEAGVYVLHLESQTAADESGISDAREAIKKELLAAKQNNLLAGWLQQARKAAQVEVNRELLDRG